MAIGKVNGTSGVTRTQSEKASAKTNREKGTVKESEGAKSTTKDIDDAINSVDSENQAAKKLAERLSNKYKNNGINIKVSFEENRVVKKYPDGKTETTSVDSGGKPTHQTVEFEDDDGKKTTMEIEFENGIKTKKTVDGYMDGKRLTGTVTYDSTGLRQTREINLKEGKTTTKLNFSYEYDDDGNLISKKRKGPDGTDNYKYSYNKDGQITKAELKKADGSKITHTYDDYETDGDTTTRTKNVTIVDKDGKKTKIRIEQELNEDNKVVSEKYYDEDDELYKETSLSYNNEGVCEEKTVEVTNKDGSKGSATYTLKSKNPLSTTYDYKGTLTEIDGTVTTIEGTYKKLADDTRKRDNDKSTEKPDYKNESEKGLNKLIKNLKRGISKIQERLDDMPKDSEEYSYLYDKLDDYEDTLKKYEAEKSSDEYDSDVDDFDDDTEGVDKDDDKKDE